VEGARDATLFFDAACGPCTFFARITQGLSRARLEIRPLDGPEAERALRELSDETRYGSFHIVEHGRTWTGANAMPAWAGLLGGSPAREIAERAPPVNRVLRSLYLRFWEYRRAKGCAATAGTSA